jgi:hypothetical protein
MKTRQVVVTRILKAACFAETKNVKKGQEKESIFVSLFNVGAVGETAGGKPKLIESENAPRYKIRVGDVIVATIVDGNELRRQAGLWVPLSVWKGGEHPLYQPENKSVKTKKEEKPKGNTSVSKDKPQEKKSKKKASKTTQKGKSKKKEIPSVEDLNVLEQIDLPFLDEYRNRDIMIRVRPPCGQGQIYYGPLGTLFSKKAKAHILKRVNDKKNIFEAEIDGEWRQIWPLVVGKKKKKTA